MMGRNKKQSNLKRLAVGGAIAAVAGYLAGVLTAPKSGKETRQDIKSAAGQGWAEAEKDLKKLNTELGKVIDEAKTRGGKLGKKAQGERDELIAKAKDAKEKVREMISAVREGDAQDKDLDRAIKDASAALQHLRKYLKK